jgi:hypothetical protein
MILTKTRFPQETLTVKNNEFKCHEANIMTLIILK